MPQRLVSERPDRHLIACAARMYQLHSSDEFVFSINLSFFYQMLFFFFCIIDDASIFLMAAILFSLFTTTKVVFLGVSSIKKPDRHFQTTFELQNTSYNDPELHKTRRSPDLDALKL